ncbi:polyphosphate kinase 1 [Spirochaeta isovalerica]|uniref:Polyphosphate kinase n=1 Tax=Spirochaeta isovalerica TaxID=150 RepID=A0A841RI03_9SPIO|nr:polyphosphate kinase 1 [Spirochaeta isovalerica]MBB6482168.1 polyphosphate kinase [Spirochaeta isovalerica]
MEQFRNKEVSWLSFNGRVLQEAADPSVPLADRIKFLGIYSNNLDEFFRVKVAGLIHMVKLERIDPELIGGSDPQSVLDEIAEIVKRQRARFEELINCVVEELKTEKIIIKRYTELSAEQEIFVQEYFNKKVRSHIFPMVLDFRYKFPKLKDQVLYLAVELHLKQRGKKYSIIEIPTKILPRFVKLPTESGEDHIIFIDEIVRFGLPSIFRMLNLKEYHSYNIKVTNDAGLDLEDDLETSYVSKINKSLKKRKQGPLVRFVYDNTIPDEMFRLIHSKMKLGKTQFLTPGGRYHYIKDFTQLPSMTLLKEEKRHNQLRHPALLGKNRILGVLKKQDLLLHFPYHSYETIIDFLREASIDPNVESISITLYRVARYSSIVNALINALRNRKAVTVIVELQARFDEKSNIFWAEKLKEEGANVIFGFSGMKVHSKLCLVTRRNRKRELEYYSTIGTGNFNEDTARLYTDTYLLTGSREIGKEVESVFAFLIRSYYIKAPEYLLLSPVTNRTGITACIEREKQNALEGKQAFIYIKMNNFADVDMGEALLQAAEAGVRVKMLVRGMFTLQLDGKRGGGNIEARSIVDKYLEHSRYLIFCNGGDEKVYITSSDLQPRNLDRRVEVSCPILHKKLRREIIDIFEIYWRDNVKARILDYSLANKYVSEQGDTPFRAQDEIYRFLSGNTES